MKRIREFLRWTAVVMLSLFHIPHLCIYELGGQKVISIKIYIDIKSIFIMKVAPISFIYYTS